MSSTGLSLLSGVSFNSSLSFSDSQFYAIHYHFVFFLFVYSAFIGNTKKEKKLNKWMVYLLEATWLWVFNTMPFDDEYSPVELQSCYWELLRLTFVISQFFISSFFEKEKVPLLCIWLWKVWPWKRRAVQMVNKRR